MEFRPCENKNTPECPVFNSTGRCFEDVHHLYYPRRDFLTGIARRFRELKENKVRICRAEHNKIHSEGAAPEKPDIDFMKSAIMKGRANNRESSNWKDTTL